MGEFRMDFSSKEKNFISAVVYVHNDENRIEKFIRMIDKELNSNFQKYEIIFVNDCSSDGTVEVIKKYTEQFNLSAVSVLNMSYYQGVELAMNAGVDLAIGDFVYEFDSTVMDYNSEIIMTIYRESLKGNDIVSASCKGNMKLSSKLFYSIFNRYSNVQYALETETFRILSRRAINRVHSISKTIPYRKAVYANCGLNVKNIKYDKSSNDDASIKSSGSEKRKLATDALVLYTDIAYRFTSTLTILMMLITIIVGIYTVVIFIGGTPIAGWTTLMLFLAFGFFGLFSILSMVLKYLSVLLDLTFKKKKYVFESIEKITK